ncbi:MAG TPA: choice-of-anchor Q domain-containing protein [Solirubrobacterales bacterium]|nr:choice-of-anchor Q domain-containing protein [Solirubrobacterales bacterium]
MAVAAVALLTAAAPALGADRYAAPGEVDTSPCTELNPCNIQSAVEDATAVASNDDVLIRTGTYSLTDPLLVVPDTKVQGDPGQPRPRITSAQSITVGGDFGINGQTQVSHLKIQNTLSGGTAFAISGGIAEDIIAEATSAWACLADTATLRDSTCWSAGAAGIGVSSYNQPGVVNLRNVTAIADGVNSVGVAAEVFTDPDPTIGQVLIDARDVIADGETDVRARTDSQFGNSADVTLSYSNYITENVSGADATVTPSTAPTNQEALPIFANAALGDFHELAGSPTIDMGATDTLTGTADIDGEPRVQGAAVDIGADETANPAPPTPEPQPGPAGGDTTPPETTITKGPKAKSKSRSATFEFTSSEPGSTFQCKRDSASFEPCTSPETFKVGKGKHSFQVRATDAAGNTDPTPASSDWKVKPKKKK